MINNYFNLGTPDSYGLLKAVLQALISIGVPFIILYFTYKIVEGRKIVEAERAAKRNAAAEFVAAARELVLNRQSYASAAAVENLSTQTGSEPAATNAKKRMEVYGEKIEQGMKALNIASAKILVLLKEEKEVDDFDNFADAVGYCDPPNIEKNEDDPYDRRRIMEVVHTGEYLRCWARRQAVTLSETPPRFDFDPSFWKSQRVDSPSDEKPTTEVVPD